MGYKRDLIITFIILNAWLSQLVHGGSPSQPYTRDSLDSYLYKYAFKKIKRLRSGKPYDVVPPTDFSGIELSIVRLRTRSLWQNGLTLSSFTIPPRILPWPFTRRVDVLYQNLGNLSSNYYNVPDHTLVAPVIGFLAYDSTKNALIKLRTSDSDEFVVDFSSHVDGGVDMKCVRFDSNGTLELSGMAKGRCCVSREEGHFSVVVPYKGKSERKKWWIMGVAGAMVGVVVCVVVWNKVRRRKMEAEAEKREELETIWIGRSRMPCASGIRTQPVLESSYIP